MEKKVPRLEKNKFQEEREEMGKTKVSPHPKAAPRRSILRCVKKRGLPLNRININIYGTETQYVLQAISGITLVT